MSDYQHILVAVDYSEASKTIAERALGLARRFDARCTFLHVVDYLPPLSIADDFTPSPVLLVDERELLERGKRSLASFTKALGYPEAAQLVTLGVPKQEIIRVAEEKTVDLIVVGAHGRHGIGRLLGSTARAVLNNAGRDVLAVHIDRSP